MPLKLINLSQIPPRPRNPAGDLAPGGKLWNIWVAETESWIGAGDWKLLCEGVEKNLLANKAQMWGDLEGECQNRICQQTNPDWSGCAMTDGQRVLSREDLRRWLVAMIEFARGHELVPQEEAERRADICRQCRFRADVTGCFGCGGLFSLMFDLLSGRSVANPENLRSCGICGCQNERQVFFPLEVLHRASAGLTYPEDVTLGAGSIPIPCWKR